MGVRLLNADRIGELTTDDAIMEIQESKGDYDLDGVLAQFDAKIKEVKGMIFSIDSQLNSVEMTRFIQNMMINMITELQDTVEAGLHSTQVNLKESEKNLKIGDKIIVRYSSYGKTPQWMDGYKGVIVKLNRQSVTVQLDEYPNEIHRVSYRDLQKIK